MGFLISILVGIFFAIIGPISLVTSSSRLDKRQKKRMLIFIIGGIIIFICVGIALYVQSTVPVPFTSLGGGLGMIPFIFFVAIGIILVIIGLGILVAARAGKKKEKIA